MFRMLSNYCRYRSAEKGIMRLLAHGSSAQEILEAARRVAQSAEETFGEQSEQAAHWLQFLGSCYREIGSPEAKSCLERSLTISQKVYGPFDPRVAVVLSNLAGVCRILGQEDEAESYYLEALAIDRLNFAPEHEEILTDLVNLAVLRMKRNDPARHDLSEAKKDLDHVRQIELARYGPWHPNVAKNHLNWAGLLIKLEDDWQGAEREIQKALEIFQRVCPFRTIEIANMMTDISGCIQSQSEERLNEALGYAEEALNIRRHELGEDHPDIAESLHHIGLIQTRMGNPSKGFDQLWLSSCLTDRIIWKVFAGSSERQRLSFLMSLTGAFDLFLSLVLTYLPESSKAVSHAMDLVLRRKGIVLEASAQQQQLALSAAYPHLSEKLAEFHRMRQNAAACALAGPGRDGKDAYRASLKKWETARDDLEAELAREIPEMNLERTLREADHKAVATALPSDAILIEYVRFLIFDFKAKRNQPSWLGARYLAFVLKAGMPEALALVDLGDAEPIDRAIADFRRQVQQEGCNSRDLEKTKTRERRSKIPSGDLLRSLVFDPLRPFLGDTRRLFCAPDGELNLVPLEALPLNQDHYIIEDWTVSYLNTGRDVLRFARPSSTAGPSLILADPDYDLSSTGLRHSFGTPQSGRLFFQRIPGTRREALAVEPLISSLSANLTRPWLQMEASKGRLKKERSPFILHIATHGFFLENQDQAGGRQRTTEHIIRLPGERGTEFVAARENPLLRSGLALAGANLGEQASRLVPEVEDGILTAEDVCCLNLLNTELIVLSACDTGMGEIMRGEGVMGLRRSFIEAGARTLVMSLWKVPDEETADLMEAFYKHLASGLGRTQALRQARLAVLARSRREKKVASPHSWEAFVILGAPGSLLT